MKKFFNEVMQELSVRYGDVVTLETETEREILSQILRESIEGNIGKKAEIKKRRIAKKKKTTTDVVEEPISFELFNEIYNDSFLLQHSSDSEKLVKMGFRKGASYNAPGSIGSAFNEVVSNEGVMILNKKEIPLEDLAMVLFHRMKNTELAKQQKDQVRDGVDIPDEISRIDQDLYLNCYLSARSAMEKYQRAKLGISKIGRDGNINVFGGSILDLKNLSERIISADNCYIYDTELDTVVKVPRLKLYLWSLSAGGGTNSGDTVVLSTFENGDILYDGWSDKKSLSDIQSNGTILNDFNNYTKFIEDFTKSKHITITEHDTAFEIINRYKSEIADIEEHYKNAALGEAKYFLGLDSKRKELVALWMEMQQTFYLRNGTSNHVEDSKNADGYNGSSHFDYLDYLFKEGVHKSSTRCKVINRLALMERLWLQFKSIEVPFELDTYGIVSIAREGVMIKHSECIEELNSMDINYYGVDVPLGKLLTTLDTVDMLKIRKIEQPENETDYEQFLKRNTHLIMGGVNVSPELIKKSLDITDITSFVLENEIIVQERIVYDNKKKYVTGKSINLSVKYKNGDVRSIGHKTYRSRQGFSGKTSNTMHWSSEVVKIFKETYESM